MKEAMYWEKKKDNLVQCHLCPRNCMIKDGERGNCKVRENQKGVLYSMVYAKPCAAAVDPIEKKPQFHFLPGTYSYSIGTAGCNLHCKFCQNWEISQANEKEVPSFDMPPEEVVRRAKESNCKTIAYTYNDPVVFYEYALDTAKLAKKEKIRNIFVCNGFINEEPLRNICKVMDGFHVDLKGFDDKYYREVCDIWMEPVLKSLKILKEEGRWFEIINLIVPTKNDDMKLIKKMCEWIVKELGPDVPLHFSRFFPMYQMSDLEPTHIETLEKAKKIAEDAGIHYVYVGNVPKAENTVCPKCKKVLIRRFGYEIAFNELKNGKCPSCNEKIAGVWK